MSPFVHAEKRSYYWRCFLVVLLKLKLNLGFQDIAYGMGISKPTVFRQFHKTLDVMYTRLGHTKLIICFWSPHIFLISCIYKFRYKFEFNSRNKGLIYKLHMRMCTCTYETRNDLSVQVCAVAKVLRDSGILSVNKECLISELFQ